MSRFPVPFGRRHSLLGHPVPAEGSASLTVGLPPASSAAGPRRGFHVPHERDTTGVGALFTPGTVVLLPVEGSLVNRHLPLFQRPVPSPRWHIPSAGLERDEASSRVHSRSPVRSSPRL